MNKLVRIILILFLVAVSVGVPTVHLYAQTATPTPTPDTSTSSSAYQQIQQQISDLEGKIAGLQGQEKTLSSQIAVMDSQIQLTQYRIDATKQQIMNLTLSIQTANSKITTLQSSINDLTKVLLNRIVATYEVGQSQSFQILVSSSNISNFFTRENYLKIAQAHDKQLMYDTVQAKNDYANQKNIYENEKKQVEALNAQLEAYTTQLDQEKSSKQSLLSQTQGSEAEYQRQLSAARAQLASFSRFVTAQGGASLLSNQTSCDSWGCYYNQRDSQWGNLAINGQTDYSMAEYGCLITSIAMVASHYGHTNVLPSDIAASGGNNFAVGTAMLRYSINVNGVSINRSRIGYSASSVPSTITSPVIVGISYDGGPYPDHFVVLVSGSNGNYIMNDPYTANGKEIPFTSHYSLGSIVEVDSISM